MKFLIFGLILGISHVGAQDLLNERIRKITDRKRSVYLDGGVFHTGPRSVQAGLKAVRHNVSKKQGYERLVFDFTSPEIPKIYGHLAKDEKKLYLDFFQTNLNPSVGSFGNSRYVKDIKFYKFSDDSLSTELVFKKSPSIDIFYLAAPGRLVVDIKL